MYVVSGATGNTGHVVAEKLLTAGKAVRVIGRDAAKLQPLVRKGAEPIVGNADDPRTLIAALTGARAVYAMIPPDYVSEDPLGHQRRIAEALAGAVRETRVPHTVFLSSVGAQNRTGAGHVSGLGRAEDLFEAIPNANVLFLRPAFYMENLYSMVPMIKQGFIATPLLAELVFPWIATADIGQAAADELLQLSFMGKSVRELHGQRDLTYVETASIVGKAIGNPNLKYVPASNDDARGGMLQRGLKPALVDSFLEMYGAMNERRMKPVQPRTDRSTTPTSLEAFAKGLAAMVDRG
jgi:uncharacterized protein YbjT (DUF2867 family)